MRCARCWDQVVLWRDSASRRSTLGGMFGDNGHGALGGRVLVVEDDADLREVMAGALAGDGHDVVEAADGARRARRPGGADLRPRAARRRPRAGARRRRGLPAPARRRRGRARGRRHRPRRRGRRGARARGRRRRLRDQAGRDRRAAQPRARRPAPRAAQRRAAGGHRPRRAAPGRRRAPRRASTATELPLTYSEFEVLYALLRAGGRLLSRQELLDAIFGGHEFRDPRAIDVHVHFLRDKLAAAGAEPDLIVTVRGAGYRLRA